MKLYQINESDLEALEQICPALCERFITEMNDVAVRIKFRRIQEILSNVRWRYGPPRDVEKLDGDLPGPQESDCE